MTADEFIAWAIEQPEGQRYELAAGEVIAMAPERSGHALAKAHIWRRLTEAVEAAQLPCDVFPDGMAVPVDADSLYEPDVFVRCGRRLADETVGLNDPVIVVEVLPRSTRARDSGTRLIDYFRLPSVRHYIIAIIALDVVPWQVRSTGKERSDMDAAAFAVWRAGVGLLNRTQRSLLLEDLALAEADDPIDHPAAQMAETTPQSAVAGASVVAERRANPAQSQGLLGQIGQARIASLGCPHCGGDEIRPWGKASGKPRYRCISCCKTFNPLTGTPLAGLRHMDRWNNQAQALINGETVAQAANRCKVAYTTAFRWRHRFLAALNLDKPQHLSGIVEADETFIPESFKGKRSDLPRAARKRGGKAAKRGLSVEQIPIMVARDRSGATIDAVLPRLDTASITKALGGVIVRPAQLCCDGGSAIIAFARRARLTFHVLPARVIPSRRCRSFTSTTSMPTTADSRNGCGASMGWPRRTCRTT